MFSVDEGSGGSEIDEEIAGYGSTMSLSRWVFDEKDDYEINEDYDDDDGYDEHNHAEMDSDEEDDNVEQRLIRTSPAVDSFDVDALEIPGAQKNEIEESGIGKKLILALQTLGVVFGDIGTSPLYTFTVMFNSSPINDKKDIIGALSLVIYTLILFPLVKLKALEALHHIADLGNLKIHEAYMPA